jgi:UDP-glucose 4-epimerase
MKILITGGSGFVGSHLSDLLLAAGHDLILTIRNESKLSNIAHLLQNVRIETVDVVNYDLLGSIIEKHKPDVIIHLAGETSHSKSFEDPLYDVDVNAKSTLFILEKIRTLGLQCRFLLGSTFIVVGRPQSLPVNEESVCSPTTIYGTNRLASEHYCKIYNEMYGLDTVVFRITNSFGPREQIIPKKNAVNFLIHQAFEEKKVTIYDNGNFFRDLIYVKDVVSAIEMIMKNAKSGNVYWISSFEKTWFYDLGKILEDLTSAKVTYVDSPQYTKKVDVGNFVVDNTKLCSLGWNKKFSVRDGIKETLDYFASIK